MRVKKLYVYNWQQACFYIREGLDTLEPPRIHNVTGNVYFVFDYEKSQPAFNKWMSRKKNITK